jgi:branched-subunit amino acid transport protein
MTAFWATLIVGVGTYATRASFVVGLAKRDLPAPVTRALRNVGPAVLASLVGSLLVGDTGLGGLAPSREMAALALAGLVAWRSRNVIWTLLTGMCAIWIFNALVG